MDANRFVLVNQYLMSLCLRLTQRNTSVQLRITDERNELSSIKYLLIQLLALSLCFEIQFCVMLIIYFYFTLFYLFIYLLTKGQS